MLKFAFASKYGNFFFTMLFLYSLVLVYILLDEGGSYKIRFFFPPSVLSQNSMTVGQKLIVVSGIGLWSTVIELFKEFPVFRDVVLQAFSANQVIETENVSEADVVYVSYGAGARTFINDLVPGRKVISIFVQCENFEVTEFSHQFIDSVDVSLGSSSDASSPNYQHTPCWLATALSRDADYPLKLPPGLFFSIEPNEWRSRSHFAAQISNHGSFPRQILVDLLNEEGTVEQFGQWSKVRSEWPSFLQNSYRSNSYLFRRFRYAVCPESSRSPSGGYTTEKIVMAHLSGAVPIFWGDIPTSEVFNPSRILTLNVSGPDDPNLSIAVENLRQTIIQLEINSTFRDAWFKKPILMPGAPSWVEMWVTNVIELINRARILRLGA
jgi:hypothetical protein